MRKKLRFVCCAGLICLAIPAAAAAQTQRFEVGQHLRAFELAWEKHATSPAVRKRAIGPLFRALPSFFTGKWGAAAQALDHARHVLQSTTAPAPEVRWAESLILRPKFRLLDSATPTLAAEVRQFYKVKIKMPDKARIRINLIESTGGIVTKWNRAIFTIPQKIKLPAKKIPAGDHSLIMEVIVNGKMCASSSQKVSFARDLRRRMQWVNARVRKLKPAKPNTDTETVKETSRLLHALAAGGTRETNFPAARLLTETEAALTAIASGKRYYGKNKTGQFWLRLKTKTGAEMVRVFIPTEARKGKSLPLVIALHGAGGSENLFFDAYGRGKIVDLCRTRGWLLVAPRTPTFTFQYALEPVINSLAEIYPVDRKRVFVVGHSMGAGQAIHAAQKQPKLFAALACLGGSGRLTNTKALREMPIFVGVGNRDFALESARNLAIRLKKGGLRSVRLRVYPDIEHIVIVQVALPDVFTFFDKAKRLVHGK